MKGVVQVRGLSHLMCRNIMWELDFHNNLLTYIDCNDLFCLDLHTLHPEKPACCKLLLFSK